MPHDTIVAIATPPGRGGIGILRLSGPEALTIAAPLLRLHSPLEANRARFCEVIDPLFRARQEAGPGSHGESDKLDEAVVTYYAAPRSYTGEHVVEIAAHGSPVLLDFLLRHTLTLGARLAEPGEFTERAFLAGRLDLTQAEAVRDLIEAQTLYQARVAASQLDGALSRRVRPVKDALIQLIARMEAGIDFAEDDTPVVTYSQLISAAELINEQLEKLAQSFKHGRLVHAGLTLAIIGAPNVGKSSLFNCLVERDRAIVTAVPGTTRDLITERISLAGIPIELIDTAGLREAEEEAERLGIAKSREAIADADLVLVVADALEILLPASPRPPGEVEPAALLSSLGGLRPILVLNKYDLVSEALRSIAETFLQEHAAGAHAQSRPADVVCDTRARLGRADVEAFPTLAQLTAQMPRLPIILTSARTGEGLAALRDAVVQHLQTPASGAQDGMLTNLRQHQAVTAAQAAMSAAMQGAAHLPDEMLLLDLYAALHSLDMLTGETTSDDVLNLIFATFCIGK